MTVYVVTMGDYSDYHIEAVFMSRDKAEIYCATKLDGMSCSIERYDTSDDAIDAVDQRAVYIVCGYITAGGHIEITSTMWSLYDTHTMCGLYATPNRFRAEQVTHDPDGTPHMLIRFRVGIDRECSADKAKKIIADRCAMWKATLNEFGQPKGGNTDDSTADESHGQA